MTKPICSCTPDPPADWVKGVCVKCWTWRHNPALRALMEQKPEPRGPSPVAPKRKSLPCIHVGERLTMVEIQAVGLESRRQWHRCAVGLTANRKGVAGVACSCEGCGPKCEGYKSS